MGHIISCLACPVSCSLQELIDASERTKLVVIGRRNIDYCQHAKKRKKNKTGRISSNQTATLISHTQIFHKTNIKGADAARHCTFCENKSRANTNF